MLLLDPLGRHREPHIEGARLRNALHTQSGLLRRKCTFQNTNRKPSLVFLLTYWKSLLPSGKTKTTTKKQNSTDWVSYEHFPFIKHFRS